MIKIAKNDLFSVWGRSTSDPKNGARSVENGQTLSCLRKCRIDKSLEKMDSMHRLFVYYGATGT